MRQINFGMTLSLLLAITLLISGCSSFYKPEKEFELLWAEIEEKINMYHQTIELKNGVRINDMWFNVNYRGSANRQHQHAGSVHFGVYYIKTPENCGDIFFLNPNSSSGWVWPKKSVIEPFSITADPLVYALSLIHI